MEQKKISKRKISYITSKKIQKKNFFVFFKFSNLKNQKKKKNIKNLKKIRVNCNFYFKIGACRHGEKCNRIHNKPTISQTLLFKNLYQNPQTAVAIASGNKVSDEALKEAINHFETFYEDIFLELAKHGELLELNVCDNLGDHLIGNVYAKFSTESEAEKALKALNGKYYNDKQVQCEYSPVTNFKECRCRQYEEGSCGRGGYCNFLHLKYVSKNFKKSLFEQMYAEHPEYGRRRSSERKKRKHRHSDSESSLDSFDSVERRKIISNWNKKWEISKIKERERRRRSNSQDRRRSLERVERKISEDRKSYLK